MNNRELESSTDAGSTSLLPAETGLDRDIACSHIRAYSYFLETLLGVADERRGCQFYAWNCPRGADDFYHGRCFPSKATGAILSGRMGENSFGQGSMYLATRSGRPYCGNSGFYSNTFSPR